MHHSRVIYTDTTQVLLLMLLPLPAYKPLKQTPTSLLQMFMSLLCCRCQRTKNLLNLLITIEVLSHFHGLYWHSVSTLEPDKHSVSTLEPNKHSVSILEPDKYSVSILEPG